MSAIRTVSVDLSADLNSVPSFFGGYEGEHNATLLRIKLPPAMLDASIEQYRFNFETGTDQNIMSEAIDHTQVSDGWIEILLTQTVTFAPGCTACVCGFTYDSNDPPRATLVAKSGAVRLIMKDPVAGSLDGSELDPIAPSPGEITQIDDELSLSSVNPVQNKVITAALNGKDPAPLMLTAAPTSSTAGVVGQAALVFLSGVFDKVYVCTAANDPTYEWEVWGGGTVDDHMDSNSTNPVQNKVITKELTDIETGETIVGEARQLTSSVPVTDESAYLFRTSGGSVDIGNRCSDTLVGGTICWNQHMNGTQVSDIDILPSGHKWLACGVTANIDVEPVYEIGISDGTAIVLDEASTDWLLVYDLTQMFGATVADSVYALGATSAGEWFKSLFGQATTVYNAGTLCSVSASKRITVGFNAYNPTTGTAHVVGGNQYQITGTYTSLSLNGTAIDPADIAADGTFTPAEDGTLTVVGGNSTDTCVHLTWSGWRNGEWEPYREYEYPYTDADHQNPPELRGFPVWKDGALAFDGDVYAPDGTVTRKYWIIDLGTKNWMYDSGLGCISQQGTSSNRIRVNYTSIGQYARMICKEYTTVPNTREAAQYTTANPDKSIWLSNAGAAYNTQVRIKDSTLAGKTNDEIKAALSGVYLIYEIKDGYQTTESFAPFADPQIVDDFGTEEYIDAGTSASRPVAVPVGHVTEYKANLRDKLQRSPNLEGGDGLYLVQVQNDDEWSYLKLPAIPTTNGNYRLRMVVTNNGGTISFEWRTYA